MDFPFDINNLFPERISVLDEDVASCRAGRPDLQTQIATVIDELGKASSKAQQLPTPITSALKLQSNRHYLYLIKEEKSNGGRGAVVGFLKVGYKKLFLLDQRGAHIEAEPLCVLDFYITESLQRNGYGLELFDFMLQHRKVSPSLLAYDRPSAKFLSFLAKHYCLTESVPQVNNFVVFDGFILNNSVAQLRKVLPKKQEAEIKPYSLTEREVVREERRAMPWPFSPQLSGSSPCSRSHSVGSSPSRAPPAPAPALASGGHKGQKSHSLLSDTCKARRTRPRPFSLPPLPVARKTSLHGPSASVMAEQADPDIWHGGRKTEAVEAERPRPRWAGGARVGQKVAPGLPWTWSVGESRHTAQWVKQKQEYRSTRPW